MAHREPCPHLRATTDVRHPKRQECEARVETLSCDSSPGRHATKDAAATGHPVIVSAEPAERWLYYYPEDELVQY